VTVASSATTSATMESVAGCSVSNPAAGMRRALDKAAHGAAAVPHAEIDALQLRVECAVVQTYQGHLRTFFSWKDLSPK
jgi:flavin-binding protein dodecin